MPYALTMYDNVEFTIPAEHVKFEMRGDTEFARVLIPRDLVMLTSAELRDMPRRTDWQSEARDQPDHSRATMT